MGDGNKKIEILKDARFVGIDLAKAVFGIVVVDQHKKILLRKMIKTQDFMNFIQILPTDITFFMESCGTSQFWARELIAKGLNARIVPAQYVSPFVQMGKKNDLNDAFAIIEAGLRDGIHFVPVKTELQRQIGSLVMRRAQLVENKVRLQNQIHGMFREVGAALNEKKTTISFIKEANEMIEGLKIPQVIINLIREMLEELKEFAQKIELISELLEKNILSAAKEEVKSSAPIRRMLSVYGVGPVTVATLFSHLGNLKQFKNGRQLSAFLGLTPRQFSSGGKSKLGSISKSGNPQLRGLLTLCAQSFLIRLNHLDQESPLVKWLQKKITSMNKKKLIIALANKLARVLWAVTVKDEDFISVKVA